MWKLVIILAIFAAGDALARIPRSAPAKYQFVKENACPATGRHRLPCPGWQIDHVVPLKCNGPDEPGNMQWLTVEDHKAKTKREARWCRGAVRATSKE